MIRAPKHFAGRVEGEGDRNGAEADAERADKEPEIAAVDVVKPPSGPLTDRHAQGRSHVDRAEQFPSPCRAPASPKGRSSETPGVHRHQTPMAELRSGHEVLVERDGRRCLT
jgi:hypothetical protein